MGIVRASDGSCNNAVRHRRSEYGRDYRLDYGLRVFEDGGMSFDLSVGDNRRISTG